MSVLNRYIQLVQQNNQYFNEHEYLNLFFLANDEIHGKTNISMRKKTLMLSLLALVVNIWQQFVWNFNRLRNRNGNQSKQKHNKAAWQVATSQCKTMCKLFMKQLNSRLSVLVIYGLSIASRIIIFSIYSIFPFCSQVTIDTTCDYTCNFNY